MLETNITPFLTEFVQELEFIGHSVIKSSALIEPISLTASHCSDGKIFVGRSREDVDICLLPSTTTPYSIHRQLDIKYDISQCLLVLK